MELGVFLKLLADAVALPGGLMVRREFVLAGLGSGLAATRWAWRCAGTGAGTGELGCGVMLAGIEAVDGRGGGGGKIDLVAKRQGGIFCLLASRRLSCGGVVMLRFARDSGEFKGHEMRRLKWMLEEVPWLMAEESDGGADDGRTVSSLSPREQEVLSMLAGGRSRAGMCIVSAAFGFAELSDKFSGLGSIAASHICGYSPQH